MAPGKRAHRYRGCGPDDLIDLIISPERIRRALADAKIHAPAVASSEKAEKGRKVQVFACHVGFSHVTS